MPNISNQEQSHPDMRLRENREELSKEHVTMDGQPDHRYKENRTENRDSNDESEEQSNSRSNNGSSSRSNNGSSSGSNNRSSNGSNSGSSKGSNNQSNGQNDDDQSEKLVDLPTKADGTIDMRYNESKEAVAAGLIDRDEVLEEVLEHGHHQHEDQEQQQGGKNQKGGQ